MLAERPRARALPVHTSDLAPADYAPYLAGKRGEVTSDALESVWRGVVNRRLVPTPTGRHALWFFLELVALPPGSEVLIAAYNYYVVVQLLVQRGLVPVFVDISPETLCMDPADLAQKVTPKSALVLVTHMLGNPADLGRIGAIARAHGLLLFEDCAHAVGTRCDSGEVGAVGDGALFSFGPEKIVNSFGGGMLALSDALADHFVARAHDVPFTTSFADTLSRALYTCMLTPGLYGAVARPLLDLVFDAMGRRDAQVKSLIAAAPGYTFEERTRAPFKPFMLAMHARQLRALPARIERRRAIIARVKARTAHAPEIVPLREDSHGRANGAYFGVYVPDPVASARALRHAGVDANPEVFQDCGDERYFKGLSHGCDRARHAASHVLRLPSYASMSDEDTEHLAHALVASVR